MDKKKLWLLIGAAALILAVVLALVLTPNKDTAPTETTGAVETPVKKLPMVGICLRQKEENPEFAQRLEEKFTQAGYGVQICDALNDQSRQTEQITELLNEEAVLLVIEPVIADGAGDTVALLKEKNIPGVFINYKPEAALELWDRLSFVAYDDGQLGSLQSQIVLESALSGDLNEDGLVSCLILSGPEEDLVAQLHVESCRNGLLEAGLLIEEVRAPWGKWSQASARKRCAKILSTYGRDVEVIICANRDLTLGALEALTSGGWEAERDFCLVGVDTEGVASVVWDPEELANQTLLVAQKLQNGEAVEKEYYVNLKTAIPQSE